MDDYKSLGIELAEPEPLDGGAVLQSMQAESPELLAGGLPFSRCTQAVKQSADAAKMTADFVIVTRSTEPNRHGNMVQIAESKYGKGLRLDEYQHNPVVLLDHGGLPIGTSSIDGKLTVKLQKTKATATVQFSQQSQVAEDVFRLVDEGVLRMASIGFMPTRAMLVRQRKDDPMPEGVENLQRYRGYDFVEAMLWEWSITAIGADAGALRQCLDCGEVGGRKFHPLLRPMLQRYAEERPAWSPGLTLPAPADPNPLSDFVEAMQRIGQHLTEQVTQAIDRQMIQSMKLAATPPKPAVTQDAPYGYCPQCGEPGVQRERRPNGNDQCASGHEYAAKDALPEKPVPAKQAACGCQNKGVDSPAPEATNPAQSAPGPVVTLQQIADAMRQTQPEPDVLANLIQQAVTDSIAPAVKQIADGNQRLADRLQTMTGALPE